MSELERYIGRPFTWLSENYNGDDFVQGKPIDYRDHADITFTNLGADDVIVDTFTLRQYDAFTDPASAFDGKSLKSYPVRPKTVGSNNFNLEIRRKVYFEKHGGEWRLPKPFDAIKGY